jgi:hypothetical protein
MSKRCKSSRTDLLSGADVDVSQKAANAIKYAFPLRKLQMLGMSSRHAACPWVAIAPNGLGQIQMTNQQQR